jgi:hypothetical protein
MTDSPLDGAPLDGLAPAFRLPPHIAENEEYVALHREIVTRLRREAAGLPMNTVQQLLLERIAANYVTIKWKEDRAEFVRANEQKDYNTFWLSMTVEFNKQMRESDDKLRQAMLAEVMKVTQDAMEIIPDKTVRQAVRRKLSEDFAHIDA